jgi:PEGA domain
MRNRFGNAFCRWAPLCLLCFAVFATYQASWAQDTVEYAGSTSSAAAKTAGLANVPTANAPKWSITLPKAGSAAASSGQGKEPTYLRIPTGPPEEVVNRRALEKKAGKDAAKILLRSNPTGARIWLNGAFVGTTPILLIVPPGKYHLKISDDRLDSAEQEIGLLPREIRDVLVHLAVYYPTHVSIR